MSGVWKSDPREEPTQKPEPSVSLATRLTGEVGGGQRPRRSSQWPANGGRTGIPLLFPIKGTHSRA